eukprot:320086-Alexandrium_andersonii.AAC.1
MPPSPNCWARPLLLEKNKGSVMQCAEHVCDHTCTCLFTHMRSCAQAPVRLRLQVRARSDCTLQTLGYHTTCALDLKSLL